MLVCTYSVRLRHLAHCIASAKVVGRVLNHAPLQSMSGYGSAELEPRSPYGNCANWYTRDPSGSRKPAGGLYTGSQRDVVDALRASAAAGYPELLVWGPT